MLVDAVARTLSCVLLKPCSLVFTFGRLVSIESNEIFDAMRA